VRYIIVRYSSETLQWEVYLWSHDGADARRMRDEIAIPKYGKDNVKLMIEEEHAYVDYIQRMRASKKVQPKVALQRTVQNEGGSF
jgi:hypothetical protein